MTGINRYKLPNLPTSTIVPESEDLFIPYFNRLYEDIAFTVNSKDNSFFTIPVTDTATDIPNLPHMGAYIVCISGAITDLPTITVTLCKSSSTASGTAVTLASQAGVGAWVGITLSITATADTFQISHSGGAGLTGNFNIRIIGTQQGT